MPLATHFSPELQSTFEHANTEHRAEGWGYEHAKNVARQEVFTKYYDAFTNCSAVARTSSKADRTEDCE